MIIWKGIVTGIGVVGDMRVNSPVPINSVAQPRKIWIDVGEIEHLIIGECAPPDDIYQIF